MARGATVTYIGSSTALSTISPPPMENDIAVVKSTTKTDFFTTADDIYSGRVYQYIGGSWVQIASQQSLKWTDETLLENVNLVRKAHMDDVRTYIQMLSKIMLNKFGDTYYHAHNFSFAQIVLSWAGGNSTSNSNIISVRDYSVGNNDYKWLTFAFGDKKTFPDTSNSRIRFSYMDSSKVLSPVMDVISSAVRIYVDTFVKDISAEDITATTVTTTDKVSCKDLEATGNAKVTGEASASKYNMGLNEVLTEGLNDTSEPLLTINADSHFKQIDILANALTLNSKKIWAEGNDGVGSGLDADKLQGKSLSEILSYIMSIPPGVVVAYAGGGAFDITGLGISDDVKGWVICNGNNGSPDLRGRFILARDERDADPKISTIGEKGGEKTHTLLEAEMPSHRHNIEVAGDSGSNFRGFDGNGNNTSYWTNYVGGGQAHNNMPPYHVLIYIMKL